ncbi:M20 aminoacylase family protein [Allopusillimonas ginsengisoli]|uniref:M20 aminoacylase family protein n=1 Tax=Allopusillimonas ginsengisoli TaxID=453575 RepID=UPI001020FA35|nr:M20 aminoacylase family protein [Allopusillimonas ginsengisoli]TEA79609.1 amidohydrolase [Allopusillimonas ginsengisoli]
MYAKNIIDSIKLFHDELTSIRQDIHAHPELGFEETRTSDLVAKSLSALGYVVHRNIGKTGVVGVLEGKRNSSGRCIGLRADMDALPILETGKLDYSSTNHGVMHACGHDGHTTVLLGAARYLAETRNFDGKLVLVFQPAEEGRGGAQAMLDDGLFERFPCDAIYGLHNWPSLPAGVIGVCPGPAMAAADSFEIHVQGRGGHGARPNDTNDPVVIVGQLIAAMQTIVSRNLPALDSAVVTIAAVQAGSLPAMNVIPKDAYLTGTVRTFSRAVQEQVIRRMEEVTAGIAAAFNANIELKYHRLFPATVNNLEHAAFVTSVATELLGAENVVPNLAPTMGSEDFSLMLEKCPGTYFRLGQGGAESGCLLHTAGFNFNDAVIPVGSAMFCGLVERSMPLLDNTSR